MTSIRPLGWTALALLALVGCEPAATPVVTPPAGPGRSTDAPQGPPEIKAMPVEPGKAEEPKKEAAAAKLSDEELAEIKKLPADEQPLAIAQMTCPVSGDHLGEMGAPIKQTIGDKSFYICCASCEKTVKSKPDEVLAKLKK